MKNKKFDIVQTIRSIRDQNYEETKDMTHEELLKWYKKREEATKTQLKKGSKDTKITS